MADGPDWRTPNFRQKVVGQIEEALRQSSSTMGRSSIEMENHVFQKAKTRDEYLALVARLILHVQDYNNKDKKPQQVVVGQGPGPGMMPPAGMSGQLHQQPDPINALQNLARQGMPPMSGNQNIPQLSSNQSMSLMSGGHSMLQLGSSHYMSPMSSSKGLSLLNPGLSPIGGNQPMMSLNGNPGMLPMVGQSSLPPGMMPNHQMTPQQRQMLQQQQQQQMMQRVQQQQQQQQQKPALQRQDAFIVTSPQNITPVQTQPLAASVQNIVFQPAPGQPARPPGPGPQQFVQAPVQQASSSQTYIAHSPAQMSSPVTMLTTPSPQSQVTPSPVSNKSYAQAPSPGNPLNTPGNPGSVGPVPSPGQPRNTSEEQAYIEKLARLSKYIEPLRRSVNRLENNEGKRKDYNKMKNLLDILTDTVNQRVSFAVLDRCEQVLKTWNITTKSTSSYTNMYQPLMDSIIQNIDSPMLNHSLHRTFGPSIATLYGSPIRSPSPPPKRLKRSEAEETEGIPDILQGEIARLHHRFKINLDPLHHPTSKSVHLICHLDDKNLPSVPPIAITVPGNYPGTSPECETESQSYESSPFFQSVQAYLSSSVLHMPNKFSLTALLDSWEMSVRKACSPNL